jgi:arylsulfatase A-like enzyme
MHILNIFDLLVKLNFIKNNIVFFNIMKKSLFYLYSIILFFFSCQQSPNSNQAFDAPNIIYIMADDLGYGDLGCYGQEIIQTPHIDQLATEGIRFTQHYSGSTVCAPSRAVLMTGMHTGHAEVRGNGQVEPYGQTPLSDTAVTVAELLKKAGYTTGLIGKWGLGVETTSGFPLDQGFDFFYGYLDQVLAHNYYPEYLWRNNEKEYLDNEVKYLDSTAWHDGLGSYSTKKVNYSHDLFTKEALNFVDRNQKNTFFLYLAYTIPHNNGEAPPGQKLEVPDYGIYKNKPWASDTMGYAAMITRMDADIGKLANKIDSLELGHETLIIFTSDNGPMQENPHGFPAFFNSNSDLRGGKRDLYEGGIRVPFIARWPGQIKAGTESNHISAFWDLMPTVCELAGIEIPSHTDGISYLPTLLGQNQINHEYVYWEFPAQGGKQAIRQGKWKAVRLNVTNNPGAPVELYDLEADPGEKTNVADKHPEVVNDLRKFMDKARVPDPNWKLY